MRNKRVWHAPNEDESLVYSMINSLLANYAYLQRLYNNNNNNNNSDNF